MNRYLWLVLSVVIVICIAALIPDLIFAADFGGFEGRMQGLTKGLSSVVLPLVSILGLVYAVILAVTGDGGARGKIIAVIGCSVVGFLAPYIIRWLQGASGGG